MKYFNWEKYDGDDEGSRKVYFFKSQKADRIAKIIWTTLCISLLIFSAFSHKPVVILIVCLSNLVLNLYLTNKNRP